MSVTRLHIEWLSLVPTSGPFLSLPVLLKTFPQGLPPHDPDRARLLRLAYEEWEAEQEKRQPDPAIHTEWVRFVLRSVLNLPAEGLKEGQGVPEGLKAEKPEQGETLRPQYVVMSLGSAEDELSLDLDDATPALEAEAVRPLMLIQSYPRAQDMEKPLKGAHWVASPTTRMADLLAQTGVSLGLVTNGEQWVLVQRATETSGFAYFQASLWLEEKDTLRAFRALLGVERLYAPAGENLADLLIASASDQQEVTDQLGYQVRRAVEMLVRALDEIDRNRNGALLQGVAETELYEATLTVMMRLVFLLCAEERELFPIEEEVYNRHYAVSTLLASLREAADQLGEEVLERRCDAWSRLQAIFKAIHGGVRHDAMNLPAYGGRLLDPARFPWLDAQPLPLHNRTVLHLLEALQMLQVRLPGGGPSEARRLSFRALDIEQIGHVYEGLLDHTARRATEPVLGLTGTRDQEPELPLSRLEALAASDRKALLKFLKEETGRSERALENALSPQDADEDRLLAACEGDADLLGRVRPFAGLVRRDDFDRYTLIPQGSVYVTTGTDRRSTGTHYTPRSLTEPIVRRTLEPLVYRGVSEGTPPSRATLRTPAEILALKVCDIATGSGAFLVQACRYLAERLCEAWETVEEANPGAILTTPEGSISAGEPTERLLPAAHDTPEERLMLARRLIAERCLYGVDKNPMAVEMAKLSLWLTTMQRNKPFHFLDHAIKTGDSLVGCNLRQIRTWSLDGKGAEVANMYAADALNKAIDLRRQLEQISNEDITRVERKAHLHASAEAALRRARLAGNLIIAPSLKFEKPKDQAKPRGEFQIKFMAAQRIEHEAPLANLAADYLGNVHPFHWPLEFPEVFLSESMKETDGFDAIIGNPPFMGGKKITGSLGFPYREHIVSYLAKGVKGHADIVAYFFLQAKELLSPKGCFGLIATNTIAQGDTREVGLEQLVDDGASIYAANPSQPWPGTASLEVAIVHLYNGVWNGLREIGGNPPRLVPTVTAFLDDGSTSGKPYRLLENAGRAFIGNYVLGMGFVLDPEQAEELRNRNTKNADVLFPYLNGEDLNSRPDQSPSRFVINFRDWPLNRESNGFWAKGSDVQRKEWLKSGRVPSDYPSHVATDYPDCYHIVETKVKPERAKNNRPVYRDRWWQFGERQPALQRAISNLSHVLVTVLVSKHIVIVPVPTRWVFAHRLAVFVSQEFWTMGLLQSEFHEVWARTYSSTLETRINYSPSDCFETFPFPHLSEPKRAELDRLGEEYHEHRRGICLTRQIGLTQCYNRFHDPACADPDIARLRELHAQMDRAVADAYGWTDLDLRHNFYGEGKETRYTLHPDARAEVLRRLLALNHARHAEETADDGDILPTLATETAAVQKRLTKGKNAMIDPADGLFGAQTMLEM